MKKNKKYNLFLDDIRVPYTNDTKKYDVSFVSAYAYTNYEPFKTEKWKIVRNYNDFVDYVTENGLPERVAFDHDLADVHYSTQRNINYDDFDEKTGYDAAKWLCEYCQENNLKFPEYIVISWNNTGKKNIISYIENYKKHVENV